MLDRQTGNLSKQGSPKKKNTGDSAAFGGGDISTYFGDTGGASRFFYCAKASKKERNAGLYDGIVSTHPTVKPVTLMRYLCKLVTPIGGVVLDPFAGSATTGIAAILEGFEFIGIEREAEYFEIAQKRYGHYLHDFR